jgi:hypothetical protein
MIFQEGFRQAVEEITQKCRDYFLNRLFAIYITGSVSACEALSGESDLDYWGFLTDEVSEKDRCWLKTTETDISNYYPVLNGVHINIKSLEYLKKDKFARFVLKHNSVLYYGSDVVSEIDASGFDIYRPDKVAAKERLAFARQSFEDALNNKCPQCLDKIPANTFMAARKFARYFILVEGAYFLMSRNTFETFKQEKIIQQLKESSIKFIDILDLSLTIMRTPLEAGVRHDDYLALIRPFVEWMFSEIERS